MSDMTNSGGGVNLTLTSVVFEQKNNSELQNLLNNLTLTSVVFEFFSLEVKLKLVPRFNFNKCCI